MGLPIHNGTRDNLWTTTNFPFHRTKDPSMYRHIATILLISLVCNATVVAEESKSRPHGAEAEEANLDIKALDALDIAMQQQVDDKHVSGVIGLIARHGKIGYYETFGQSVIENKTPMTKETLFRIYSMTKPIVAVTAMSIWEEGKFKLHDPISVHLPEWKEVQVKVDGDIVATESPITPRHLMTHSSGLSYDKDGLNLGRNATLEEFSQALAKKPLNFQPGTNYVYGYSIDILGRYIEAIEGKSLDVVMRERVFDRLAMDDTEFWVRETTDRERVAQVYRQREKGDLRPGMISALVMRKPSRMMGGQGLISTAGDYARFCQMLLNKGELDGKRVLKTETANLMFQNHLGKIRKVYGLGGVVDGTGGYSWGGAAGTKFWIDTRKDCYGVFMIQTWGYSAPTYRVFRKHVDKAILAE
ncbi:MAG TPA: class A beta-lactamase-related serine hydrolase [Planctomycetaceae bacterium]|nr:class A beta-lactamase-related serine hydrolase [Planctomycetaceae bacterium]